jgi:hypothetical protein
MDIEALFYEQILQQCRPANIHPANDPGHIFADLFIARDGLTD